MLYLLFRGEAPTREQARLLETLAVALANPGPRDPSVHAAMCAGVCGSTAASSLIAALAAGSGGVAGGRDVLLAMQGWEACGMDLDLWRQQLASKQPKGVDIWPELEHPPGFDLHGSSTSTIVKQALACLAQRSCGRHLPWLAENIAALEKAAGLPFAMSGVAAAAFFDLGFSPEQAELLHLMLRLPGAAAHALEQRAYGFRKFPFFSLELLDDPAKE